MSTRPGSRQSSPLLVVSLVVGLVSGVLVAGVVFVACAAGTPPNDPPPTGAGGRGGGGTGGSGAPNPVGDAGRDAAPSGAGGSLSTGAGGESSSGLGGAPASGGAPGAGQGGQTGSAGTRGGAGGGGGGSLGKADAGAGTGTGNCNLPTSLTFQKDVQPFLITSCGGGNGCHVIDSASTTANGGFNHAYDWITAGAHPSSCPATPTPKRFQVVIDVIDGANPVSCSKSRIMPPQNETGANLRVPLTSCQIAALQAWLDQPLVTQMHRVDDTDPTGTPAFPMPPFN